MTEIRKKQRFNVMLYAEQAKEIDELCKIVGKKRVEIVTLALITGMEALKMAFYPNMEAYYKALDKMYPLESSSKDD